MRISAQTAESVNPKPQKAPTFYSGIPGRGDKQPAYPIGINPNSRHATRKDWPKFLTITFCDGSYIKTNVRTLIRAGVCPHCLVEQMAAKGIVKPSKRLSVKSEHSGSSEVSIKILNAIGRAIVSASGSIFVGQGGHA
jgi:hypothetical protein